jgi:mannose-6-phosphate isomerase-like protein (cupin superfamily)
MTEKHDYKRFKPSAIARSFPATAETRLIDTYLTNEPAASARVWRVYHELPPHYHAVCDEYLYVLSGRGISSASPWSRLRCARSEVIDH